MHMCHLESFSLKQAKQQGIGTQNELHYKFGKGTGKQKKLHVPTMAIVKKNEVTMSNPLTEWNKQIKRSTAVLQQ